MRKNYTLTTLALSIILCNHTAHAISTDKNSTLEEKANKSRYISLDESLALAIENNPDFRTLQENFKQSTEVFSQAIAENFMPKTQIRLNWFLNKPQLLQSREGTELTMQLPLFNGGAGVASLKQATLRVESNKYTFYKNEQSKILECITDYLQYHFGKETYELQTKAVEAYHSTYKAAEEKYRLGEETSVQVSLAKSELSKAEVQKLNSLASFNNSKEKFINDFNVEPDLTLLPELKDLPFSNVEDFVQKVLIKNIDILNATNNIKLKNVDKYVTVAQSFSPNVSLFLQSSTGDLDPFFALGSKSTNNQIAMNVAIPILGNGGREFSTIRAANSSARSAVSTLLSLKDSIIATATNSWEKYEIAKQTVEAQKQVLIAKTLVADGTEQEYTLGTKSLVDWLNAQNQKYAAAIDFAKSKADLVLNYYKIQELLGGLTSTELKLTKKVFSPDAEFNKRKRRLIF